MHASLEWTTHASSTQAAHCQLGRSRNSNVGFVVSWKLWKRQTNNSRSEGTHLPQRLFCLLSDTVQTFSAYLVSPGAAHVSLHEFVPKQ
jgi:hypothetical protein